MSYISLKSWFLDNIPDYSQKLTTVDDLVAFRSKNEKIVPKVYLLSSKFQEPKIFSALTAHFRDRVDFAFMINDGSTASTSFKQMFEVTTAPSLLLEGKKHSEVYAGNLKLPEIIAWLEPHALATKIERTTAEQMERYMKQAYKDLDKDLIKVKLYADFQTQVLDQDKAALVYFSTGYEDKNLLTLVRAAKKTGSFINCVWYQVEDYDELKLNFKSASHLPMFRVFNNF